MAHLLMIHPNTLYIILRKGSHHVIYISFNITNATVYSEWRSSKPHGGHWTRTRIVSATRHMLPILHVAPRMARTLTSLQQKY